MFNLVEQPAGSFRNSINLIMCSAPTIRTDECIKSFTSPCVQEYKCFANEELANCQPFIHFFRLVSIQWLFSVEKKFERKALNLVVEFFLLLKCP